MKTLSSYFDSTEENSRFAQIFEQLKGKLHSVFLDPGPLLYKDASRNHQFSPHIGYINLFPLFFGYLSNSTEANAVNSYLKFLSTQCPLCTNYGLTSLSPQDSYFGHGDNYWTSPIWININYLVVRGLYKFYSDMPSAKTIYSDLRKRIVENVCNNWESSGFFFENYNFYNGRGQKAHPFNGWTSLVSLILFENY